MKHAVVLLAVTLALIGCSDGTSTDSPSAPDPAPEAISSIQTDTAETQPVVDVYPIDTCVVSGEKLGSMGDVVEVEVEGRQVKLCCAACESQLRSEPAKYLAILDAAAAGDVVTQPAGDPHHDHDHQNHAH